MPTLKLLRFDTAPHTVPSAKPQSRTSEIAREYVPGLPRKLFIYRLPASPYWWVRFYIAGRVLRKSSKQSGKREALAFAQQFYQQVMANCQLGLVAAAPDNFRALAKSVLALEQAKLARGDITAMTYRNFEYRFEKSVLPFFGGCAVADVNYMMLERYVTHLSQTGVSAVTVRSYLQLVRKVLSHASKHGLVAAVPEMPSVRVRHKPRGWFTPAEYLKRWRQARKLTGQTWEIRKYQDTQGRKQTQYVAKDSEHKQGARMCYVRMTQDLVRLIEFMANGTFVPLTLNTCGISMWMWCSQTTHTCACDCLKARFIPIPSPPCHRQSGLISSSSSIVSRHQAQCKPLTMCSCPDSVVVTMRCNCCSISSRSYSASQAFVQT